MLVEQPGPWGVDAPFESNLPIEIARLLRRRARKVRARFILVRRHRPVDAPEPRSCFVVDSNARRIERFEFEAAAQLAELDLSPLGDGQPMGGESVAGPLLLTCTNGRHDACCAEFGRPVAAVLDTIRPELAWESSHIGGDRFAANVVVLPGGIYLGRVDPDEVPDVVHTLEDGRLPLELYRGRSTATFVAQAAEAMARRQLDLDGIDALVPVAERPVDEVTVEVILERANGDRLLAEMAVGATAPALLTCHSDRELRPPAYELRGLRPVE